MTEEQKLFETWARKSLPQFTGHGHHSGEVWVYDRKTVQLMWECWKARAEVDDGKA